MILIKYVSDTCIGFHRLDLEILCSCYPCLILHADFIEIQNMVYISLILRFLKTQYQLQNCLIVWILCGNTIEALPSFTINVCVEKTRYVCRLVLQQGFKNQYV